MKKILLTVMAVAVSAALYAQTIDSLIGKKFVLTFATKGLVKKYNVIPFKSAEVGAAQPFVVLGFFKTFHFMKEQDAIILLFGEKDTTWMSTESFTEGLAQKAIWNDVDFFLYSKKRDFTDKELINVLRGVPWIGMQKEDLYLLFGMPDKTTISVDKDGYFSMCSYEYFGDYFFRDNKLFRFLIGD